MKSGLRNLAILLFPLLSMCGPGSLNQGTSASLVSITIEPAAPGMAPGTTLQLQAVGNFSNNSTRSLTGTVTWISSDPSKATVNATGLVTSLLSSSGSFTVTAISGAIAGSAVVTLSPVASITVTPAGPSLAPGTTQQFAATATLENAATQDLTRVVAWMSSDAGIATVSSTGLASAATGTITGNAVISAGFSSVTGTTLLTVAALTSIAVAPANVTLVKGTTQQFTATGNLANNATQNLTSMATWTVQPAGIVSINGAGLGMAVAEGSATVTAVLNGTSGSSIVTVTAPVLTSLAITPTSATIAVGANQAFTATGTFSDGTSQNITADAVWSSSNTQTATISSGTGTAGIATGVGTGTTLITASFSGRISNAATLTVTSPPSATIRTITVTPPNPILRIGSNTLTQFAATAVLSDGTSVDITPTATWASSNGGVATISNSPGFKGQATATGVGTTTITATSGTISGSTTLTVQLF